MEKVNVMYSAAEVHADISLYAAEFKKEWESFSEEDEKAILARRRLLTMGFSSSSSIHSLDAHIYGVLDKRIFDWYQERFPNSTFLKVDDFTTLLQKYNLVCNRHTCYRGEVSENTMEVNDKRYQTLLSRAEALLLEARSIYAEIYSLRPEVEAVNRKRQRLDLEREMRGRLIKSAKIKVR